MNPKQTNHSSSLLKEQCPLVLSYCMAAYMLKNYLTINTAVKFLNRSRHFVSLEVCLKFYSNICHLPHDSNEILMTFWVRLQMRVQNSRQALTVSWATVHKFLDQFLNTWLAYMILKINWPKLRPLKWHKTNIKVCYKYGPKVEKQLQGYQIMGNTCFYSTVSL